MIETAVKYGFEVQLYTSSSRGFLTAIPGVVYRPNYYRRSPKRWITFFTFFFSQLILALVICRHLVEKSTFYTNTILPFSAILAGRIMGKRVITHVHESEISPGVLDKLLFWIVRNLSSEKIVVSGFLAGNPKLGERSISLIPNVVNQRISDQSNPVSWSPEKFTVLMLASLRPYKGTQEFVNLANRLSHIHFVLVLSDPADEVEKWKGTIDFGPNIEIFPVQEDVISFYQKSQLLLNLAHPDKWLETFGMTVLEGFCFGIPAIVPTQGGVAELVEEDQNGYKIDYTDPDLMANKVLELAQNQVLWERLSRGALIKSKEFSIPEFERKVLEILNA